MGRLGAGRLWAPTVRHASTPDCMHDAALNAHAHGGISHAAPGKQAVRRQQHTTAACSNSFGGGSRNGREQLAAGASPQTCRSPGARCCRRRCHSACPAGERAGGIGLLKLPPPGACVRPRVDSCNYNASARAFDTAAAQSDLPTQRAPGAADHAPGRRSSRRRHARGRRRRRPAARPPGAAAPGRGAPCRGRRGRARPSLP